MRTLRRAVSAAVAAGAALALACVPAATASAFASYTCDSGYLCLYDSADGQGGRCQYTQSQHDLTYGTWRCRYAPGIGSAYNRRGVPVALYSETGCRGTLVARLAPNQKLSTLRGDVRSVKVGTGAC